MKRLVLLLAVALSGADAVQAPAFLKWMVGTGYVTEYQASLLAQGHADDFFLNQYKILERIGRGKARRCKLVEPKTSRSRRTVNPLV